jgi:hypothetical protein
MQYTFKPFLSFLLAISFSNNLISVKERQDKKEIVPFPASIPEVRNNIIYNLVPRSFNKKDKPKIIHDTLMSMRYVSKELNQLVRNKQTTQTIIDIISEGRNQNCVAKKIGTPEMINYLTKSSALYKYVQQKTPQGIDKLLHKGADINYSPRSKYPLLFKSLACYIKNKTVKNYNKTKYILDHGANPNFVYQEKTALQYMIEKNDFLMIKLLLSYNPQKKCLPVAAFYGKTQIILSILQHKDIPLAELNESLGVVLQKPEINKKVITALIAAGAQLETVMNEMKQKINAITNDNI